MKNRFPILSIAVLIPTLVGCAVGPDYKKQEIWAPSKWQPAKGIIGGNVASQVTEDKFDPNWWECFHDPVLSNLERRVVSANLDVQMATQRFFASRAQLLIAGADRFPTMGAAGSYNRTQYSNKFFQHVISKGLKKGATGLEDTINPSDINISALNEWSDALDTSWELDLWGRVRRRYEASHALLTASEEDRRAILIVQLAEVAKNYVTLRELQTQLHIVKENKKIAQESLILAQKRFVGGLVTELDVQSAKAQLEQTQSDIPQLEQQISEYINALGLLLGEPPRALEKELSVEQPIPPVPPLVPVGIPSELVERRPDIREADAKLHAATAEVGMAMADFYPKVTVDARLGFQSISIRDLGFWSARAWNVGPTISLPIFEGGKLKGQLTLKKAEQKESAIAYKKAVLQAWQEVDNALTAYQAEQLRRVNLEATVIANQHAVALAQEQYRQGLQNFINVLDAETRLLNSQKALTSSTSQVSINLVQLYKALGGGWEATYPKVMTIPKNVPTQTTATPH